MAKTREAANAMLATVTTGSVIKVTSPPLGTVTANWKLMVPQTPPELSVAMNGEFEATPLIRFVERPVIKLKLSVIADY